MASLEKLLTAEEVEFKRNDDPSGETHSMAVSAPLYTDFERKNALCKYRLVKNERSIDIYEEGISGEMKEIRVRVDKHPQKAKKQLLRYEKSCNNDVYENDLIPRTGFRNLLTTPSCCFVPSLKEAAIEAVVSILTSSINCFAKDANFRASLGHNCLGCLSNDLKSVYDLKRIIVSIERRVKIGLDSKELKKDSLKLFELIHGVGDSQLTACGNLYIGLIYKLQKKEKLSAKHLLQVFVYSPFSARTVLLPNLWNRFFSPNLSHLKSWYYREVKCFRKADSRERRVQMLEKRYDDLVDNGTRALAMYYLEWLEGQNEVEPLLSYVSSLSVYSEISCKRLCETVSIQRKVNKEPALNEDEHENEFSEESSYPFRLNVPQGKENALILRKLALETFKLR